MALDEQDRKFFLGLGVSGKRVRIKDEWMDDHNNVVFQWIYVDLDAGVSKVHQGEPYDWDVDMEGMDLRYFLFYGKPGRKVVVTYDTQTEDGRDERISVWVDLDNGIAKHWSGERFDERFGMS